MTMSAFCASSMLVSFVSRSEMRTFTPLSWKNLAKSEPMRPWPPIMPIRGFIISFSDSF